MLGRAVNLYFITKYKNISTRKRKYCRAAMRIKEFILYGLIVLFSFELSTDYNQILNNLTQSFGREAAISLR